MIGFVVCRPSPTSPSALSFFAGTLSFVRCENDATLWSPETGWLIGDAFVFGNERDALHTARAFNGVTNSAGWFVLPTVEDAP